MLILSLIALVAGPLLYHWLRQGGWIARTVEQLVVAALVLVVGLLLVPETLAGLGYAALLLIAAGYLVPGLLEAAIKSAAHAFHIVSVLLALAGLVLHALLDGAGLAGGHVQASLTLGLAIVLHRLGMGLVLWLIVQPAFGRRTAAGVLLLVGAATVLGYYWSDQLLTLQNRGALLAVQALIIGTIVHSLIHRGHIHRQGSQPPARAGR